MKDPIMVLRQKESDLTRVRREVEALQLIAPLLIEDRDEELATPAPSSAPKANAHYA